MKDNKDLRCRDCNTLADVNEIIDPYDAELHPEQETLKLVPLCGFCASQLAADV